MPPYFVPASGEGNPAIGAVTLFPGRGYSGLWCATAMDKLPDGPAAAGNGANSNSAAVRAADTCYIRGFRENVRFSGAGSAPWQWRRIVFSCKGLIATLQAGTGSTFQAYTELNTAGVVRLWQNLRGAATDAFIQGVLFKGQQNVDYLSVLTAKVDTNQVKLHSDVTRTLKSGNAGGMLFSYTNWYPVNANVTYGNDESGDQETNVQSFSSLGRGGLGDVYVYDILDCVNTSDSNAFIVSATTLYWHEK